MAEIHVIKLLVIFLIIVVFLWFKRPLYQAILAGIITTVALYRISLWQSLLLVLQVCSDWGAVSLLLIIYLITLLQRMLEKRRQIVYAQQDLNGLFNNRRINATIAPSFIGLLPSAAAMILCGDIVKHSTEGYLDPKEQAFVTSWFRHIPESTLPTYAGVLLMSNLSNVPVADFIVGMIVPVICLFTLGYFSYI